jgi:hypothetical protein
MFGSNVEQLSRGFSAKKNESEIPKSGEDVKVAVLLHKHFWIVEKQWF